MQACFYNPTISQPDVDDSSATELVTSGSVDSCGDGFCAPAEDNFSCPPDCPLPFCGDGIRGSGEACDDGNKGNTDQCLNDCTKAYCGDSFVLAGDEVCDDGDGVNSDQYSAVAHCNATCKGFAPFCGDKLCQTNIENAVACPQDCLAMCGNGIVEGDEQCDKGIDGMPASSSICDKDCTLAECGDGVLNESAGEVCDDGNLDDADACPKCQSAVCGDGFLHSGFEECDDGPMGVNACRNCKLPRQVFLTSLSYNGNLGGLLGADAKCNQLAQAAAVQGIFKAWLSSAFEDPATRFDTGFTGAYTLTSGEVVAVGWSGLTGSSLEHAIDSDESQNLKASAYVWTNTGPDGKLKGLGDCQNWTSSNVVKQGALGDSSATDVNWTDGVGVISCATAGRIYCFQQ